MTINEQLAAIEERALNNPSANSDAPALLKLARYLIPIAEDHLPLDEARELRQKIEEILS